MQEFFLGQMDYIFFIYGLAFFFLFFICISFQKKDRACIPWDLLGIFGLIHGINEWLDLSASSLGDVNLYRWVRLIFMAVSFIYLFEFGRLTCERLKYINIGRWIYIPLGIFFILERSASVIDLNDVVRYSLGLTGALWAALGFWRISRENKNGGWDLPLAAFAMMLYAIAAGFIVPKAGVLFAAVINHDSFFHTVKVPIQLLRGFLACVITGAIWHYYEELRWVSLDSQMIRKEIKFAASLVVGVILILSVGWFWVDQMGQNGAAEQRGNLLGYSQQVFESLDVELIKKLAGSSEDLNNPDYLILKNELQQIRETMRSVRFIYLMRKSGDKIIFLADSEPAGSKDESPPGQEYVEASPVLKQIFKSGEMVVYDQYTDRWGTWFSIFTSLYDERTGKLIAVLGIDENKDVFNFSEKFERFKGIVLIGIICLSMLLILIYWQRFVVGLHHNISGKNKDLLIHWGVALIVGLIGVTFTFFLFLELRSDAWDLLQATFQQRAKSRIENISQEVQRQLDRLNGLCQFMGSNDLIERETFDQYVEPFLKDVPVHAFAWVPRVKKEDRFFYESSARQDGLDGYQFYENNSKGKKIPVLKRDEYFPVYYVQPLKGNDIALGFDMASDPIRRAAMQKSCDTAQPVVTPPLVLMQALQDRFGFLVFIPVYAKDLPKNTIHQRRKNLKGYVLGVYSSQEFLKGTYSRMPAEGLACLIEDPQAPKARQVLYRHKIRLGTVDWDHPLLKFVTTFEVADRQWRVTIIPGTTFIKNNLSKVYWWALVCGLFLTAVVAAFLNFLATARYRAENLVKMRTAELSKEKELLRKREEDFHLILDSTAEAIYGIDLNGNCTFTNPSCLRMLGFSDAQDLLGKNMHELMHHSYPDGMPFPVEKCQLFSAFKNNLKVHVEEVFWRSDGSSFYAEVWSYPEIRSGKSVGAVVSFWDITERKRSEEALRKREAYLTSILDNFPYLVWLKDSDGHFLAVNEVFARSKNLTVNEVIGKTDFDIFTMQLAEKYHADDLRVMSQRQKVIVEETIITNGVEGYFETYKSPIFDNNGFVIGTVGFAHDITERKKAEDMLREAKETAESALAVKEEFTSTVSHELRTPLAAIKSSIDILDTEVPGELTKDQKVFIKRVKSNIDRLARLINDVLDLSKLESGKMVMNFMPIRAEALVQDVVDIQAPIVNAKGLKIDTEFGENLPTLIADKDRLIQVLNNLINNALKFTKEGGIVIAVHSDDKQLMTFSVRDTGIGIQDEDLSKLFQKFQQVGASSQQVAGTGLGLAICKMIISKHNGRIWVESKFGKGSSFNFVIPIRKEKRILIVDDDLMTLDILRNILELEDIYEIETASDGFQAGQKYIDFNPHLIILDVKIPKINGLEVCLRMKSDPKTKNTRIIMLSSFDSEHKRKEAWDAGADEIINKPINAEEFIAKIRKLI